jgi:hypothetical protein
MKIQIRRFFSRREKIFQHSSFAGGVQRAHFRVLPHLFRPEFAVKVSQDGEAKSFATRRERKKPAEKIVLHPGEHCEALGSHPISTSCRKASNGCSPIEIFSSSRSETIFSPRCLIKKNINKKNLLENFRSPLHDRILIPKKSFQKAEKKTSKKETKTVQKDLEYQQFVKIKHETLRCSS